MNKIIIIAVLSLVSFNVFCQFFPENDAVWTKYSSDVFGTTRIYQYIQTGDTVISNQNYNKIYFSIELWDNYVDTLIYAYYKDYKGGTRLGNDQNKVFFIPKDSLDEVLLYNFDLLIGDTIPVWHNNFSHPLIVESIDTMIVNAKSLKRFNMRSNKTKDPDYGDAIIEGIGSIKDLVYIENRLEGIHGFLCFWDKKEHFNYPEGCKSIVLSTNREEKIIRQINITPNPCSSQFVLSFSGISNENQWIEIVDTNGKKVKQSSIIEMSQRIDTRSLTNGIYILMVYNKSGLIGKEKLIINK